MTLVQMNKRLEDVLYERLSDRFNDIEGQFDAIEQIAQETAATLADRAKLSDLASNDTALGGSLIGLVGGATLADAVKVGLFSEMSSTKIPTETKLVETSGVTKHGLGSAKFAVSEDQTSGPVAFLRFQSGNGVYYDIAEFSLHARMIGIVESNSALAAQNATRLQAAIDWIAAKVTAGTINGMTISFEGMGQVYLGKVFLKTGVFLYGGRTFGRGGGAGCCRIDPTGIPDGEFCFNIVGTSSQRIFNWGIAGFYIRGGGSGTNFGGIYGEYASDGALNVLHMNNFGIQCIKLGTFTGVINIARVFTQGLHNSAVITTYSGSIELAGGDYTVSECEFSGPSQNVITSRNLYCAAARLTCNSSTFTACIFQTGDIGICGVGSMSKFIGCRVDTNAGHGIFGGVGGDLTVFEGTVFNRNGYATVAAGNAAEFTGSMSGTVLTVESLTSGQLYVGDVVTLSTGVYGVINSLGTGTGGAGTYNMSVSRTIASSAMSSKLMFDDIFTPSSGSSMGRIQFNGIVFESGTSQRRYYINDQRGVSGFRSEYDGYKFGSAAPYGGYVNITGAGGPGGAVPKPNGPQPLPQNAAIPSVLNGANFYTNNTAATTITGFADGVPGQRLMILVLDANTTFQHGSGINLTKKSGTFTAEANTVLEFINRNNSWYQIGVGPRDIGWTTGSGTAAKGAYATVTPAVVSGTYTQAEVQALRDGLVAASQRILALEQTLRNAGMIN